MHKTISSHSWLVGWFTHLWRFVCVCPGLKVSFHFDFHSLQFFCVASNLALESIADMDKMDMEVQADCKRTKELVGYHCHLIMSVMYT